MSAKRFNKSECNEIAKKMCKSIDVEINAVTKQFSDFHRKKLLEKVPKSIMGIFNLGTKTEKLFIITKESAYLYFGNNRYVLNTFNTPIPVVDRNEKINLSTDEVDFLNKLYDRLDMLKSKKKRIVQELEETLFLLGTPKKITEHFPEALPYLPKIEDRLLPQINLEAFRLKLKAEIPQL